ncbi:hypothetical protein Aazo_0396 ['Nostoc azollae' 0708]|uniref:Uncharacterized protein n=1 Tax=Nostoc azollae (strain 0708) TaxID=551115 RepID=D7DZK1_NOSA0|nr:hypothetical protein Aazo_0396 ['Nostoc azollae' 0708]
MVKAQDLSVSSIQNRSTESLKRPKFKIQNRMTAAV